MKKTIREVMMGVATVALAWAAIWSLESCPECVTMALGLSAWCMGAKLSKSWNKRQEP